MTHPILDATKRLRLVYDPNGEARYMREREGRWIGWLVLTVILGMVGLVHLGWWVG